CLFLCGIMVVCSIKAQMILPSATGSFDRYPNFNREWIKKNKIKSITFDILDKKDYQVGKDEGLIEKYEFDSDGKLTRFYFTEIAKQTIKETYVPVIRKKRYRSGGYTRHEKIYEYDTISTRFFYDKDGRLILSRYNEGSYYEGNYYEYDGEGRITRELRCKETNLTQGSNIFTLGVQNVISEEKFEYQKTGNLKYKKKCLNDEGRVFREIIINTDEGKRIKEMNENFTVTWISQKTKFWYNNFGQLTQKTFESNADGTQAIRDTFEYDNKGNIIWEKQFMNDVLLNERSYIFNDSGDLVNSFVIRNHTEKSMRITKIIYDYRKPE
ncbi:MAG: hypothetical protein ACK452_15350, partial [Bacteroidota bacterium]